MAPEPDFPWRGVDAAIGACAACGIAFERRGRGTYCSKACRDAAWRWRKAVKLATPPKTHPKLLTIYECTTCETRFVDVRRCPECNLFNRRIDLGGSCPHCDEPVALNDLTEWR